MNATALKQDSRVHDKVEETQVATAESASISAQAENKRRGIMLAIQQAMLAISDLMLAISHVMDKIRGGQDVGHKETLADYKVGLQC